MNTSSSIITVNGMNVEVVRKHIKNLHLAVYPPEGRIRVAVPLHINDDNVRLAVINKLAWIKRQQSKFRDQPRQSKREYVTGESHYFRGRKYRLDLIKDPGPQKVEIRNRGRITMSVHEGKDVSARHRMITEWYRQQLKEMIPPLLEKWQSKIGVEVDDWQVKIMRTRWGSCNQKARRIWLNLELAKKPVECLEYVVVHEILHLLERTHNDNFVALMNRYLPKWQLCRAELNKFPVKHEDWKY